ncbi:hypothetical protein F4556_003504 [Kitasatospora gansuensis]|uniref:Uncharacterized protein n=1 Tax=Kitasatospora gansuensis TaxID=258050 RepID=A0A7W7WIV9_9ACTN|nr:hypothetical protein [Kitasatospora gansuensis]MBB4947969.1 hypothetical protein [Kitasatospora gansuensis]
MSITETPPADGQQPQLPLPAQLEDQPPAPRRALHPALRAGAAVLAAAVLGVGIGVGILRTQYSDEDTAPVAAATPSTAPGASASPSFGAKSNGTHFGSLRELLLPMPEQYRLGPDAGTYGNDTDLTEDQRKSWVEDQVRGLPKKLQDALRKEWESTPLKGGGVRTYISPTGDYTVTVWLLQYHQDAVKADAAWNSVLASDSGLFRLGPKVPGHEQASCFLPDADPGDKIDRLVCSAAEGDLRVEMEVEGIAPLPKDKAVNLFSRQLDRLARPGASV